MSALKPTTDALVGYSHPFPPDSTTLAAFIRADFATLSSLAARLRSDIAVFANVVIAGG